MRFSSSALFLLAAIQGTAAFLAPATTRSAVVPSYGSDICPPLSGVKNVGKVVGEAVATTIIVKKLSKIVKELDDLEDADPEESDEKASLVLDTAAKVLDMTIKDLTDDMDDKSVAAELNAAQRLLREFIKARAFDRNPPTLGFAKYKLHPEFPTVPLWNMPKMCDQPPPLSMFFSAKKIGRIIRLAIKNALANRVIGQKPFELAEKGESEEAFSMMFTRSHVTRLELIPMPTQFIPKPEYTVENWEKDEFQGRQFLNGVNPVMIRVAQELGDFSEEIAEELGKDNLQGLIDQKRLFFVSFDELAELKANPHQAYPKVLNPGTPQDQPRYFDPAIAVFVLSEDRQILKPTAIQLDRAPGARVYTRDNSGESEWLFAKAKLQTADSQYHEWVSHLGMTHFATEPHIIAIYNVLKRKNHKLSTFLWPLMKDTLFLNWVARDTLAEVSSESFGDYVTSVGTGQFMQLIQKKWQKYDFFESGLDKDLASRGFTEDFDMPAYLFREDGMKLWKSFGTFATDFVDELYETDDAVAKDAVVQEWAKETSFADKGAVPGFPESFTDKATLAKALQTIMWMTSGLHAAVNFPQFDFYSFGPNNPLGARASVAEFPTHKSEEEQRAWIFNHYMPTLEVTKEVIQITQILTLPSLHTINVLDKNFETVGTDSYAKFKEVLEEIGDGITERNTINKEKGLPLYDYLHPDNVSASIDI